MEGGPLSPNLRYMHLELTLPGISQDEEEDTGWI